jgi:hypothetical protein
MNKEIVKQGFVDVKVLVSGLRQHHRLEVKMEKLPAGEIPVLVAKHYIPTTELLRLAEMLQLPVRHNKTIVFPPGKMAGHFAEKKISSVTLQPETIEAEVEG